MLVRLADQALTLHIAGMLVEDLAVLPDDKRAELRRAAERMEKSENMDIAIAHTVDDATLTYRWGKQSNKAQAMKFLSTLLCYPNYRRFAHFFRRMRVARQSRRRAWFFPAGKRAWLIRCRP